jgi:hypothetical protein
MDFVALRPILFRKGHASIEHKFHMIPAVNAQPIRINHPKPEPLFLPVETCAPNAQNQTAKLLWQFTITLLKDGLKAITKGLALQNDSRENKTEITNIHRYSGNGRMQWAADMFQTDCIRRTPLPGQQSGECSASVNACPI